MKNLVNRPELLATQSDFHAFSRKKFWQEPDEMKSGMQPKKQRKKSGSRK